MKRIEMEHIGYVPHVPQPGPHPGTLPFVQIDAERCVGCDTCQEYCPTGAIFGEVGREHAIPHPEACINCGQCLTHCPELAIYEEQSWVPELEAKLARKDVRCIAMPAPAVRYALGDCFGLPVGSVGTGRMLSALKALGFAHCWDTEFAADVTIWEEASEFVERLAARRDLPQFTSCCPGWQKYAETFYPDLLPHFSSCKSPIGMNGALAKTYGAERMAMIPTRSTPSPSCPASQKNTKACGLSLRPADGATSTPPSRPVSWPGSSRKPVSTLPRCPMAAATA